MKAIETHYAGHRFRSRLEAHGPCSSTTSASVGSTSRRASSSPATGTCRTSCSRTRRKGDEDALDYDLMEAFAYALPRGARIVILGPLPESKLAGDWDWAWQSLCSSFVDEGERVVFGDWVGFGSGEPAVLTETSGATPFEFGDRGNWLEPSLNMTGPCVAAAYDAARQARFEHGESGAPS
jgi:hypothetical protein